MARPSVEAERREQILAAACTTLAETGLTGLRVSDVAKSAGVSSGTVHYYFTSKKELVNAAFEYNFTNSLQRRQWLMAAENVHAADSDDPIGLLRDIVDSYLPDGDTSTLTAWRVWADLWAEGMRDVELQEMNERLYGRWRQLVADVICRAQELGHARDGDPVRMADMLISMIDGLAMQALLHSQHVTNQRMRDLCRAFINHMVNSPTAAVAEGED